MDARVLGTDVHDDLRRQVAGMDNLEAAILRRLQVPRGGLFYQPDYGLDIRLYLNEALTQKRLYELQALIEAEALKDARVLAVAVAIEIERHDALIITLRVATRLRKFALVVEVGKLEVKLLHNSNS